MNILCRMYSARSKALSGELYPVGIVKAVLGKPQKARQLLGVLTVYEHLQPHVLSNTWSMRLLAEKGYTRTL